MVSDNIHHHVEHNSDSTIAICGFLPFTKNPTNMHELSGIAGARRASAQGNPIDGNSFKKQFEEVKPQAN
eukprot:1083390-Amphidinium_carterae.1